MTVRKLTWFLLTAVSMICACGGTGSAPTAGLPASMKEIPAGRLNYRYEPDVPAPPEDRSLSSRQERNAAIQTDFDQARPQELLDKTVASPDGKRILAVYHRVSDGPSEFRLDMYSGEGKILRTVTAEQMAVHFPDTIVWSPNSENVAFVAMVRAAPTAVGAEQGAAAPATATNTAPPIAPPDSNVLDTNADPAATPRPAAPGPAGVLTFRTEQIYLANADGDGLKPMTQNEGIIYFYYVWAPDSTALAASAITAREWQFYAAQADSRGENFVPRGRARIIEKNGRERRLDDNLSAVQPVWSPDSSKVAVGFEMQVRVYDATGITPTQAAIPLRNNLLLSSAAYDRDQEKKLQAATAPETEQPAATPDTTAPATLPDPNTLVSFNPIVMLNWPSDDLLYFQTAYVKRMKNEADSVSSFQRWHRLVFTPQPVAGV